MKIKLLVVILIFGLPLAGIVLTSCKSKEQRLKEEAKEQATKFWETRVFRKCGGEFGDYFGRREGKIYQFDTPIAIPVDSKPAPNDLYANYEWYGQTILLTYQWRMYENGVWSQWQKEEIISPGLIKDFSRKALMVKTSGQWIFGYAEENPTSYKPVDCKEIEALHPPE